MAAMRLSAMALLSSALAARVAVDNFEAVELEAPDATSTANHTFEDCQCGFTSGLQTSCCAAQEGAGMGSGKQCGRRASHQCGGASPVCCASHLVGSVCCPAGSSCSTSCRGDGGRVIHDGGSCRCQPPPAKTATHELVRYPVMQMFAHLSQAAYCGYDGLLARWQNLSKWEFRDECAESGLRIKRGSIQWISRQDGKDKNANFAFVGQFEDAGNGKFQGPDGPRDGDCVLSIAGSTNYQNLRRNFQFRPRRATTILKNMSDIEMQIHKKRIIKRAMYHTGFMTTWSHLADEHGAIEKLYALGCGPGSGRRVFPTGHSLGSAVASIAALDLKAQGFEVGLTYVFNGPRFGNRAAKNLYRQAFGRPVSLFRVTHKKDPVPRVPPSLQGYRHVGAEIYFPPSWPDERQEYVVCADEENKACSKRYNVMRTVVASNDHCQSPLVSNGDICQLPDFCQEDLENPKSQEDASQRR